MRKSFQCLNFDEPERERADGSMSCRINERKVILNIFRCFCCRLFFLSLFCFRCLMHINWWSSNQYCRTAIKQISREQNIISVWGFFLNFLFSGPMIFWVDAIQLPNHQQKWCAKCIWSSHLFEWPFEFIEPLILFF